MEVGDQEVNPDAHDSYLAVIGEHAPPLGEAMESMTRLAGGAARSEADSDLAAAADAMDRVGDRARAFLRALSRASCPEYLQGADAQLHDALKLIIDGGERGGIAARNRDGQEIRAAAQEIDTASHDVVVASQRLVNWRSGEARPARLLEAGTMSTSSPSPVIAEAQDTRLRRVVLRQKARDHIVRQHRQLDGHEMAIMRAVETADIRCAGNYEGAEELYAENLGPARWLVVVVAYSGRFGSIVTAYPYSRQEPPTTGRL